jgi:lysophospholipase
MKRFFYLLPTILLLLHSCHLHLPQLSEGQTKFVVSTSQQLQDESYSQRIDAFYEGGREGTFIGEKEVLIYYKIFRQQDSAGPAIMISSGRTEAAIKYKELIYDLYNNGYTVYIHDHRGQGQSGRLVEDPEMGFIDTFQFYINDMKNFHENYVKPQHHGRVYLMAHSMGGAIGMTYLEQYPGDFDAAAFSSPMLGLKWYVCPMARLFRTQVPKYGPGQSGYNREEEGVFDGNILTGSEIRFQRALAEYDRLPEARLGGASIQWVRRSCEQFGYLFKNISNIQTPFILFSATNEQLVNPRSHQKFVEKVLQLGIQCEAYQVENAQHELFVEKDRERTMVLDACLSFFSRH